MSANAKALIVFAWSIEIVGVAAGIINSAYVRGSGKEGVVTKRYEVTE